MFVVDGFDLGVHHIKNLDALGAVIFPWTTCKLTGREVSTFYRFRGSRVLNSMPINDAAGASLEKCWIIPFNSGRTSMISMRPKTAIHRGKL